MYGINNFRLLSFFIIFVLGFSFGCGTKKKTEVRYVMPPKWVLGYAVNENFSAIGVISIDKKLPLTEIISRAEDNAIENLRSDILVKFENCFISSSTVVFEDDRNGVVKNMNTMANNVFSNSVLKTFSRRDDLWISPDNNAAYLMVSGDREGIVNTFINELDSNIVNNNPGTTNFITRLKSDILDGSCFNKKNDENKQIEIKIKTDDVIKITGN